MEETKKAFRSADKKELIKLIKEPKENIPTWQKEAIKQALQSVDKLTLIKALKEIRGNIPKWLRDAIKDVFKEINLLELKEIADSLNGNVYPWLLEVYKGVFKKADALDLVKAIKLIRTNPPQWIKEAFRDTINKLRTKEFTPFIKELQGNIPSWLKEETKQALKKMDKRILVERAKNIHFFISSWFKSAFIDVLKEMDKTESDNIIVLFCQGKLLKWLEDVMVQAFGKNDPRPPLPVTFEEKIKALGVFINKPITIGSPYALVLFDEEDYYLPQRIGNFVGGATIPESGLVGTGYGKLYKVGTVRLVVYGDDTTSRPVSWEAFIVALTGERAPGRPNVMICKWDRVMDMKLVMRSEALKKCVDRFFKKYYYLYKL